MNLKKNQPVKIYLIVGHRGTGKTSWLKKLKNIFAKSSLSEFKNARFWDLDQEVEKHTGRKIKEFFPEEESTFRRWEIKTLNALIDKHKHTQKYVFIAVGAGFKGGVTKKLLPFCQVVHLMREIDPTPRVFLERPRLDSARTPVEEYQATYPGREKFYQRTKDESFILPEQDFAFARAEKCFFNLTPGQLKAVITLNKKVLPRDLSQWPTFVKKRLFNYGLKFFELRDDDLTTKEIKLLRKIIPREKQLLSFKKPGQSPFTQPSPATAFCDWPLEKGPPPSLTKPPAVLSLHKRGKTQSLKPAVAKLLRHRASCYKLAVPVQNLRELMQGHRWFLQAPLVRAFLPVSKKDQPGRWRWYRQIFGPYMPLHFIRESLQGVPDQPFLYEHLMALNIKKKISDVKNLKFGAVVGQPVAHSASPAFYRSCFARRGMIFTKIPLQEKEFTNPNLQILQDMGLWFLAVTSPLKKKALQICDRPALCARQARAVNTLIWKNQQWWGYNTDAHGLEAFFQKAWVMRPPAGKKTTGPLKAGQTVAVWGGGGMKSVLQNTLPFAVFYSARTGKPRLARSLPPPPQTVVWAVGRNRMKSSRFPPASWKPQKVVDLNYTEDSPGREYALRTGAKYVSGKTLFQHQAKKQKSLFLKHIE